MIAFKPYLSHRKPPCNLHEDDAWLFEAERKRSIPACEVVEIAQVQVLWDSVFKPSRLEFFDRHTHVRDLGIFDKLRRLKLLTKQAKNVVQAAWITDDWSRAYFHWMTDALPRYLAVESVKGKQPIILASDYLNIPFVRESVDILNLSVEDYPVWSRLHVGKLLLASHPAPTGNFNRELMNTLRSRFLQNTSSCGSRRIYVSRSQANSRRLLNEEDVIPILREFGFEIHRFEDYTLREQIDLISQTRTLAGIHGAGLTNMLFMPPGGKILELRFENDSHNNCYFTLSSDLGHDYYYLQCNKSGEANPQDLKVDRESLRRVFAAPGLSSGSKMVHKNYVIVIDWNPGGHNADYVNLYQSACNSLGYEIEVIVSDALADQLEELNLPSLNSGTAKPSSVSWPKTWPIRPRSWQLWLLRRQFANRILQAIETISRCRGGLPVCLIFSTVHENDFDIVDAITTNTSIPWFFLYLHPYYFVPRYSGNFLKQIDAERILRKKNLVGIATLNEDLADPIRNFTGKHVAAFPDVTCDKVQVDHPLTKRFRTFAGDRTLVVLAGYLSPWKGTALLAQAALAMDPNRFAFVFAGELALNTYDGEDKVTMQKALTYASNAMFHLTRMPDDMAYNAVIQAADIIASLYTYWPFSSNTITKAALFGKPIVVNQDGLPGQRVAKFRLGAAIEFNLNALTNSIEHFDSPVNLATFRQQAQWDSFLETHGFERLRQELHTILRLAEDRCASN